jgi:hypothetical protein
LRSLGVEQISMDASCCAVNARLWLLFCAHSCAARYGPCWETPEPEIVKQMKREDEAAAEADVSLLGIV